MKWNWGTGIFIVIVLFLGACFAFIIYSQRQKWSMVEEDYYPKELRHEEKLVKMRNANALSMQLEVRLDKSDMIIQFPADFHGGILWADASSSGKDIRGIGAIGAWFYF